MRLCWGSPRSAARRAGGALLAIAFALAAQGCPAEPSSVSRDPSAADAGSLSEAAAPEEERDAAAPDGGRCTDDRACDDGDACTRDACSSEGRCSHLPAPGADCADALVAGSPKLVFAEQDSSTQIYSPTVVKGPDGTYHLWAGGWRNEAEVGNDKIFHATSSDLVTWSALAPVITSDAFHYNDPSVVVLNDPATNTPTFVMYMTRCGTIDECFAFGGNQTAAATSFDGVTWSAPELVIGAENGLNGDGAWAPSAIKMSDALVYLYFHSSATSGPTVGSVMRAAVRPAVTGFFAAASAELVDPRYSVNVDVVRTPSGIFEMYYNGPPVGGVFTIRRRYSLDGLRFEDDPWFVELSGAPASQALTPNVIVVDAEHFWLFFGWGKAPVPSVSLGTSGLHQWMFRRSRAR